MCDTKKQRWGMETLRPPKDWSMPEAFDDAPKRNTDLRPYAYLVQHQLNDVHEREDDAEPPYAARLERAGQIADTIKFATNLEFINDWKQYEQLELIIHKVDLEKVSTDWLRQFREDLDLKV